MRFLIDAQLPPGLATRLQENGHDADHVSELGLESAEDSTIWAKAMELGAILLTKDEDFVAISEVTSTGPVIVWLRLGNATNRVLIPWFEKALPNVLRAIESGERVIEVR